ncbi:protein containing GCN5-related N-acetyltransferase domain [Pseudovibrio sp. FO-BEG1]|uniref:Acetyltransferase (GNAT) domain-containing protein n=1 Tax=Pseudovibrio denitrificans TaxID=258256 RepID=A0A1I7ANC1_9HYPH|nr:MULTISPECIES: GNAT family N-acetyltransferase [Pseudovibrio]AEV34734.1 protein containing GCN5-related N-acetyltransferase domain [Pseudovibrio sp. FO-BEG1]EEA93584.1 acetyltransferase, GNAT family [Pseudovibrio sp. JE062]SFT76323.1 Acetyltransferase (GNAT) domain-containing protein [Pseudovibrio denitrificans]
MVVPIVRVSEAKDLPALLELEAHYMAELEPQNFERWKACEAVHRKRMEEVLARTFAAEMADEIRGYCYWGLQNDGAHIFNVYVHPDFRRYGLAKYLLERTEEDIRKKGFSHWTFNPIRTHPAKVFIEQLGYKLLREDADRLHMMKGKAAA